MTIGTFLIFFSGIVLFLIGMVNLSSAVRKLIDVRIKEYIKCAVGRPLYGLLTGIISTIAFQSSSASIALTIGLVSAGLISFANSLAIILGADIGTTLTVQFVIWNFTKASPLIISIGGLLWLSRRDKWETVGEMIFYFGLMFFGLELIGTTVEPLKHSPKLIAILRQTQNPLIGIGFGMIVTGVVQASAIPISIMVLLAQHDLVSLENAVAVVMGANIGTTATALIAGAFVTKSGKKTAFSHLFFKCVGVTLCFVLMPLFFFILRSISSNPAQQIAFAHFLVNLIIVLTFIPVLKPFASWMNKLIPGEDEILPIWPEYLDPQDISDAHRALDNVHRELKRQMNMVLQMYLKSIKMITQYQEVEGKSLVYVGMVVKNIRKQIVNYLWEISSQNLSEKLSGKIFAYTAMANDIESLSIHVSGINRLAYQKDQGKIRFSQSGEKELSEIIMLVSKNFSESYTMIHEPTDKRNTEIINREEEVDIKVKEARNNHLKRFHKRLCDPEAGPIFVEMLLHLERISDLCNNVSEYMWDTREN